jgi:hypothetical protein
MLRRRHHQAGGVVVIGRTGAGQINKSSCDSPRCELRASACGLAYCRDGERRGTGISGSFLPTLPRSCCSEALERHCVPCGSSPPVSRRSRYRKTQFEHMVFVRVSAINRSRTKVFTVRASMSRLY